MSKPRIEKEYILDNSCIDEIAELVMQFCGAYKIDSKDALRYRLSIESCLLKWLESGLAGNEVRFVAGQKFFKPFVSVECAGESINPYIDKSGDYGPYCSDLLVSMNLTPEYVYGEGKNRVSYAVKRKRLGQLTVLGLVILAAVIIGFLGNAVLPAGARDIVLNSVVTPLYDTFFNILSCVAAPMIFMSVAWGIYGIGDTVTLGRIGKRMMLSFIGTVFFVAATGVIYYPIIGPEWSEYGTVSMTQFSSVSQLILGIFPSNIVEPFATGNTLQIIFLAIVIGIALLFLGQQTTSIAKGIQEINVLVKFLMEIISRLVPYVIFLVMLNMIWTNTLSILSGVWKLVVVMLAAFVIAGAGFIIFTAIKNHTTPALLFKKALPGFLVAFTTASSAATFSMNMTTCEKSYGISPSLSGFGIPLGMVMHRPIAALYNLIIAFYLASVYDIDASVIWIVVAVFISAVVAIATPPIPGGGAISYAIIFTQLGIPTEALALAFTIDIFFDFFITSFEMLTLQMSLINVSSSLGMIDTAVLKGK
ncbi:MAG: dicarboxylate/amino acid:cation symporter [Firmicutes bacterium]|nr:dicarboxylate/amino acid:cation symporter [Bacillota bacterium]